MGWNIGYTIYENTVVNVYDSGVLTKELLNRLMQPFVNSDMDHGGCMMLRSKDGLSADEIVCKVMEPDQFKEIPGIPDEMPQRIKLLNGKYSIAIYGIEYSYDTWQGALQEERDSAVEALWNEITRREWELW